MTWVRLDDRYPRSPKVMGLSDRAFRIDVESICYCAEQDTDGHLPDAYTRGVPKRIRDELVAAHRWDMTEDGLVVHDYLEYNPSANERDAKSEAASNAARMRWASATDSDSNASTTRGRVGVKTKEVSSAQFDEFWAIYPLRVGKRAARVAFERALKRASFDVVMAGVKCYVADPRRNPEYTAHPTTWLNQDRWEDDPKADSNGAIAAPYHKPYDPDAHFAEQAERLAEWLAEEKEDV